MKTTPEHGIERPEELSRLRKFGRGDENLRNSRIWSLVYYLGNEHASFLKEAYGLLFSENALNPMAFKCLELMETEIVQMTGGLLNGDERIVGTMTSGPPRPACGAEEAQPLKPAKRTEQNVSGR